jgi:hypothetical protein
MEDIKVKIQDTDSKPKKSKKKKSPLVLFLIILVVVLGAGCAFGYYKYQQANKKTPDVVAKEETDFLVERIGKLIDLPKDETPTTATILDKEKLKDQPFFNNAQNGDKILIYTKAQKAIVFRVKDNKIINVGPISLNQNGQVSIAVVSAGGNTNDTIKKLTDKFGSAVTTQATGDAKNKTAIKTTTVVDVSGQNAQAAQEIATLLGGSVGSLPSGETAPQGAMVVVYTK